MIDLSINPYFLQKYNEINLERETNNFQPLSLGKTLFLQAFKYLHLLSELLNFFFNAKYLLNPRSQHYSFFFFILQQKLEKFQKDDNNEENPHFIIDFFKKYFVFLLFLSTKFFDWYFLSPNTDKNPQNIDNKLVSAPFGYFQRNLNYNYCNLCNKEFRNPTCLAVSGYVFCYTCIEEYVKRHGKCPVTHLNCSLQSLHKIYKN